MGLPLCGLANLFDRGALGTLEHRDHLRLLAVVPCPRFRSRRGLDDLVDGLGAHRRLAWHTQGLVALSGHEPVLAVAGDQGALEQAIDHFLDESVDFDELLGRTVRLLSQLTNQVAIVQYPTLGATRVRHIELVALGNRRALCIVITDNGRIEQRLLDLDTDLSEADLSELRSTINAQVAGKLLTELAESVISLSTSVSPHLSSATNHIASALSDSIQANRQQKLVMAGTANLVRTEEDFHGSIYPVLDAIEEQVILLKLLTEMKADAHEVAVSIGREHSNSGLEQTSLLATGYTSAGESATLGLLGPTRMDYSNNIASIRAVARYLTRVLDAQ